jgi:hypothetical protein
MIDTSPAIQQVQSKVVYVRKGHGIMAISNGKNSAGKWRIIDLCFGAYNQAIAELQKQGYLIKTF